MINFFSKKFKLSLIVIGISFPILFLFQNCSNKTQFSADTIGYSGNSNGERIHLLPTQETNLIKDEPQLSVPIEIKSTCDSYIEIKSDQFSIPIKDASNICYYKKIFTGIASNSTSNYEEMNKNSENGKKLMMQEQISLIVNLARGRRVVVSSDFLREESFVVDNFLLVQVDQNKPIFSGWSYEYENTQLKNNYDGSRIDISFYSKDAYLNAWEITNLFENEKNLNLKISTLDNGGAYQLSPNTYLVFK